MDDFESVWSALPIPGLVVNRDMTVEAANPAAEVLLRTSGNYLRGKNISAFAGASSMLVDAVRQVLERDISVVQHDVEIGWQDKSLRLGTLQAALLGRRSKQILLLLHPRGLAEKMDRSLGYRTAARSVTGMAAMLAHEIRNPLAGIKGAAQLLSMNLDSDDRELTQLIEDEASRIGKLVDRVEEFGDLRPAARKPVNIHDVLHRAVTSARAGYATHARIREEYDPSLPPTAADGDQLLQVFQNLLKNASEALPPVGGIIGVHTAFRPGIKLSLPGTRDNGLPLEILIADNGKGVPAELQEHIFEPFVSSRVNGSGLGLSLVSKILTDHGGVIECDSEPGRTVFRVLLPVWNGPDGAPSAEEGDA